MKISGRGKKKQKWNIKRLKRNNAPFQKSVEEAIKSKTGMKVNQKWTEFKRVILRSAEKEIGYEGKERARKPWITKDMIRKDTDSLTMN